MTSINRRKSSTDQKNRLFTHETKPADLEIQISCFVMEANLIDGIDEDEIKVIEDSIKRVDKFEAWLDEFWESEMLPHKIRKGSDKLVQRVLNKELLRNICWHYLEAIKPATNRPRGPKIGMRFVRHRQSLGDNQRKGRGEKKTFYEHLFLRYFLHNDYSIHPLKLNGSQYMLLSSPVPDPNIEYFDNAINRTLEAIRLIGGIPPMAMTLRRRFLKSSTRRLPGLPNGSTGAIFKKKGRSGVKYSTSKEDIEKYKWKSSLSRPSSRL